MSIHGGHLPRYVTERVPRNTCCRVYGLSNSYVFVISSDDEVGCIALKSDIYDGIKSEKERHHNLVISEFGSTYYLYLSPEEIKYYQQLFLEIVNVITFNLSPTPKSPHPGEKGCHISVPIGFDRAALYKAFPGGIGIYTCVWDEDALLSHLKFGLCPFVFGCEKTFYGVVDVTKVKGPKPRFDWGQLIVPLMILLIITIVLI